ncbi:MAG: HAD family hydrolase [Rhodocyclales bacterium]|nr:HAD family hydrolase [Rhodocyclales bacterium]
MQSKPDSRPARRTYTAVIFDFEGTLVDFQWRLAPAEDELRQAFGKLGFHGDDFRQGNYATMWNAAADLHAPQGRMAELRAALGPIYDRWDADALARWQPRPDAADLLGRFAAAGTRVAMVSNIGWQALSDALSRFRLDDLLSQVVSRDDVTYMKPRAEGILRVIADWKLAPETVLFVGDSRADVLGARAAGIPVAIIRGGECLESAFINDPPDHMISSLGELIELVATDDV